MSYYLGIMLKKLGVVVLVGILNAQTIINEKDVSEQTTIVSQDLGVVLSKEGKITTDSYRIYNSVFLKIRNPIADKSLEFCKYCVISK